MTQIVLPTHANNLGTAFGGQIAAWIDICAAVSAQRLARAPAVTASMDSLLFRRPVRQGMVVVMRSQVNRVWRSSMEVGVRVEAEDPASGTRELCCTAYLTFVVVDAAGAPVDAPTLDLSGDAEAPRRWEQAEQRRQARLELRRLRRAD
ncbi:MAG: acyl-CoA thioesterase [Myxococcales bacterium]|nr:acyl-CoA thioesterase [Myxococcales bacterium]MCB9521058.1 acyl-CoA thioesterase [Myxococcales bacterium]